VSSLISNLVSFYLSESVGIHEQYGNFKSFKMTKSQFAGMLKTKVSSTPEKTKQNKNPKTVVKTLKPTKPSLLATVFAFERRAVEELYEVPWSQYDEIMEAYEQTSLSNAQLHELLKTGKAVVAHMWKAKQAVLKITKNRLFRVNANGVVYENKQDSIADTSRWTQSIDTAKSWAAQATNEKVVTILPSGAYTHDGLTYASLYAFLSNEDESADILPYSSAIVEVYDDIEPESVTPA
jgi:hypothetical protein